MSRISAADARSALLDVDGGGELTKRGARKRSFACSSPLLIGEPNNMVQTTTRAISPEATRSTSRRFRRSNCSGVRRLTMICSQTLAPIPPR